MSEKIKRRRLGRTDLSRQGKDTTELIAQYRALEQNGDDCVECGECMPWCEYRLNIPVLLKEAHKILRKA